MGLKRSLQRCLLHLFILLEGEDSGKKKRLLAETKKSASGTGQNT